MKRHRHSTVLEWHAPAGIVSYIHLDRLEVRVQQRHVVNVSEPIGYRGTVNSANREGSQQRRDAVTDYARLHDVRVDVDGIEPAIHVHHVFGYNVTLVLSSRSFLSMMVFISSSRACTFLPKVSVRGGGERSVSNIRGSTKAILRACSISLSLPLEQHLSEQG